MVPNFHLFLCEYNTYFGYFLVVVTAKWVCMGISNLLASTWPEAAIWLAAPDLTTGRRELRPRCRFLYISLSPSATGYNAILHMSHIHAPLVVGWQMGVTMMLLSLVRLSEPQADAPTPPRPLLTWLLRHVQFDASQSERNTASTFFIGQWWWTKN